MTHATPPQLDRSRLPERPEWVPVPADAALLALRAPPIGARLDCDAAKRLALTVALRGAGWAPPNPLVGAVIVDAAGGFVAMGAHERHGQSHAEVMAFAAADAQGLGERVRGGTLYVTLEPCAHQGKTAPCAPRVAAAGIARVVYGAVDPNPLVNGRGEEILRAAGIACEADPTWATDCEELTAVFLTNVRVGRPFVGMKAAATLDGLVARKGDEREWITGPRARAYGHFLRQLYDGVAIGRGTLMADDPTLDPRDALLPAQGGPERRVPWRVVVDPELTGWHAQKAAGWRLLGVAPERVAWIARDDVWCANPGARKALEAIGGRAIGLESNGARNGSHLEPQSILAALATLRISSVLLEGGAGLYAAFLAAGLVDRLHLFQAPRLAGTQEGDVRLVGPAALSGARLTPLDGDWLVEAATSHSKITTP